MSDQNVFEKALIKGASVSVTQFEDTREQAERFIKLFAEQFNAEYSEQNLEGNRWFYLHVAFPLDIKVTAHYGALEMIDTDKYLKECGINVN